MLPRDRQGGCERGLVCRGRCGRPCSIGSFLDCPKGFFCMDDPSGAACQPTCMGDTCPVGRECISEGQGGSSCAEVYGTNCQRSPCPKGFSCAVDYFPTAVNAVWMQCLAACGASADKPCPSGTQCYFYGCRTSCEPGAATSCGPGFKCLNQPGKPPVCVPDSRNGDEHVLQ